MAYVIQADVEQLQHTATLLRNFRAQLNTQHQQLNTDITTFLGTMYWGHTQIIFDDAWNMLQPVFDQIIHRADELALRLNALADRICEADTQYGTSVPNYSFHSAVLRQAFPGIGLHHPLGDYFSKAAGLVEEGLSRKGIISNHPALGFGLGFAADVLGKHIDGEPLDARALSTLGIANLIKLQPHVKTLMLINDAGQLAGNSIIGGSAWLLDQAAMSDGMRAEIDRSASVYQHHFQATDLNQVVEAGIGMGLNSVEQWVTGNDVSAANQAHMATFKAFGEGLVQLPEASGDYVLTSAVTVSARISSLIPGVSDQAIDHAATTIIKTLNDTNSTQQIFEGTRTLFQGINTTIRGWI